VCDLLVSIHNGYGHLCVGNTATSSITVFATLPVVRNAEQRPSRGGTLLRPWTSDARDNGAIALTLRARYDQRNFNDAVINRVGLRWHNARRPKPSLCVQKHDKWSMRTQHIKQPPKPQTWNVHTNDRCHAPASVGDSGCASGNITLEATVVGCCLGRPRHSNANDTNPFRRYCTDGRRQSGRSARCLKSRWSGRSTRPRHQPVRHRGAAPTPSPAQGNTGDSTFIYTYSHTV
jgi:hypothetical protein